VRNSNTRKNGILFRAANDLASADHSRNRVVRGLQLSILCSESILPRVKKSQDDNFCGSDLVAQQVIADPKFPNIARIELAEPRASAREIQ
jgi:hypothetical protein